MRCEKHLFVNDNDLQGMTVEDHGTAQAIVNGREQQNSMKAQQLQASTHYHVSKVLLKPHVL